MSDITIYFPKMFVANRYVAHKYTLVVRWVRRCGRNIGIFSPKILSNDRPNTTMMVGEYKSTGVVSWPYTQMQLGMNIRQHV